LLVKLCLTDRDALSMEDLLPTVPLLTVPLTPASPAPVAVAIALGSNLGDSAGILSAALVALAKVSGLEVQAQSSFYRTAPVGPPQPDYLNACALLAVTLSPETMLETLLQVEQQFGRVRRERWGPRLLDLDLLFYGDRILTTPTLELPHPRMIDRAFVLVPLAEIVPQWRDPRSQRSIAELLHHLDCSGVQRRSEAPPDPIPDP